MARTDVLVNIHLKEKFRFGRKILFRFRIAIVLKIDVPGLQEGRYDPVVKLRKAVQPDPETDVPLFICGGKEGLQHIFLFPADLAEA